MQPTLRWGLRCFHVDIAISGAIADNVPGLYDIPRSGEAGLARRLRLSASDVTKGNVPEGPEGAKRPERIARVSRSRIGVAPLSVLEIGAYIQRAT